MNPNIEHYLIDKGDSIGKGADFVISLLHHYSNNVKTNALILFADNCVGQNKNHAMIQYLKWRLATGLNKRIELNFILRAIQNSVWIKTLECLKTLLKDQHRQFEGYWLHHQ